MNWRLIRRWTMGICFFGGLGLLASAWFVGGALVAPANRVVGPPPDDFAASTVEIASRSGTTLAAWYQQKPKSVATVILFHPIRSDRSSMLSRARLLSKLGYNTLLVDLQAHGESKGDQITVGYLEKHDVIAAVNFVRDNTPSHKIAIIGWSLGGASALFAQPDVDAMVLEAVYPTVTEAVHNRIAMRLGALHHVVAPLLLVQLKPRLGVFPSQLCPIDQLPNIHCPVLITSGDEDKHTLIAETKRMFNAANGPKQLVVFEGAGHEDLLAYDPEKYETEIIKFIENVIH